VHVNLKEVFSPWKNALSKNGLAYQLLNKASCQDREVANFLGCNAQLENLVKKERNV